MTTNKSGSGQGSTPARDLPQMTHQLPDSTQHHGLFCLVFFWISSLFWVSSCVIAATCAASCAFSVSSACIFDRSVTRATSLRMFPGPQLPSARLTPRVMCSNLKYWFWRWVSSVRTCWKGVSGSSKLDKLMSL